MEWNLVISPGSNPSKPPLKILHIGSEFTWRGGENQIRYLIDGLIEKGIENHLAYPKGAEALNRFSPIIPTFALPSQVGFDPRNSLSLFFYCLKHKFDLIHAHSSKAHSIAVWLRRLGIRSKVVVHRRIDKPPRDRIPTHIKYRSKKVDHFVAVSHFIKDVMIDFGVDGNRISVIRSAVEDSVYSKICRSTERRALSEKFGIPEDHIWIGSAAALTHQKGHGDLFKSLVQLKKTHSNFTCLIAGEGELEEELLEQVRSLELEDCVRFVGFLNDVSGFLKAIDILAAPSRREGLGTILLDGLFAGCAIAATKVGGIPEIVEHGVSGLLSESGDHQALTDNLIELMESPDLREKLNAQGIEKISREFSLDEMVENNYSIYMKLLN